MTNLRKPSIEGYAEFFINEHHPDYKMDFDKCVKRIAFSNSFVLKIFNNRDEIEKAYFISPIDSLVAETSQPFFQKMLQYFTGIATKPPFNYFRGYIEVDEDFLPQKTQVFKMPEEFNSHFEEKEVYVQL